MALWICSRPPEKCHPAEMYVAERLGRLSDDWIVSWGFRYGTGGGTEPEREGDFAVQSPSGHICAIEVKSGRLRQFALTGFWESSDRDNPADQLHAEWHGVIALLESAAGHGTAPLVHRALALPNVAFVGGDRFIGQLSRRQLLDQCDLEKFPAWWSEMVAKQPLWVSAADARQISSRLEQRNGRVERKLAQSDDAIPRVVLLGRLAVYGSGAARLHEELITVTARWIESADRKNPLTPYGRDAEAKTISLLQESLKPGASTRTLAPAVLQRLQTAMARDIVELLPQLTIRGEAAQADAEKLLAERGRIESEAMRKTLDDQRRRVLLRYEATGDDQSVLLGFSDDERRQLSADRRHWQRWLTNVDGDLARGPRRIADFYRTRSYRLEPVGLAYLWPVTG